MVACFFAALTGHAEIANEHVVLQLPYSHQFQFAGVYAAMSQGYFKEHHLDVELRTGTRDRRPVPEVESGRAQYAIAQSGALLDRLNGSPVVALAAIFQHSPFVLMMRADSGISTPADLIGRRLALSPTNRYTEMRAMLLVEGLKPEQLNIVPDQWNKNELLSNEAEVISSYITDGPFEAKLHGMDVKLIRPYDYGVDFYGDFLLTSESELQQHPARARAMREAILRGWEYALAHREEMIEWIFTQLPADERSRDRTREWLRYEADATAKLINADLVELGHMNPGRWQRMADLTVALGQARSAERLQGFVFDDSDRSSAPGWIRWVFGGLGITVIVALTALLANRRLQSLVRHRTQELAVAERRQREYFELAPAPIIIEDYTAFEPVLAQYRQEGVTDLRAWLRDRPVLTRDLLKLKRIVAANRLALVRSGYSDLAELDRQAPEMMTEQSMLMFIEELVAIWEGRDNVRMEKTYVTRKGETIHTLITWEIGQKDGRRDLANVRLVFTEVTQQKLAEQALRQSEERYRQLFEHAVGGIYRSSPNGEFISVNPALAHMLGFDHPDDMIAWTRHNPMHSLYMKPARRQEFTAAINARGEIHDFESEVRSRDGTRWISESARAVHDEQGQLRYYEGFVTDITARRQLESEIARASKLEAVGILAGGIAHDFNNILTVVLGNITLVEGDVPSGSELAARLFDARRATLRARDLTLQLLTFAKGGEPVKATIELPELLKESAGFALHGAKARAEFRIARDLWRVSADKGQLGQVIQNLVINAVQAMPAGGVVTLAADNVELGAGSADSPPLPPGRYVQLAVADNGTGIARDLLAKIFDPYFTTKAQGSGLGLATAYSIIRKHEGHIVAESEPGQGTTFRFWLPAGAAATGSAAPTGGSRSPFRARVLFMDDEAPIRAMAVIFMERIGYDCDVAADGAEAVRKYEEAMASGRKYEVVLMDLTVPGGIGGREAMERLKRIDPGVCAIVSSGYSRDPVLANYRTYGFQAILPKPYGLEQLTKVMTDVLDGAANRS